MVARARTIRQGETAELTIELHPRELGKVRLQLISSSEGLTARLVVGDWTGRRGVGGQRHLLRQRLNEASCPVVSCSVTDQGGQGRHSDQQQTWRQRGAPAGFGSPARLLTGTAPAAGGGRGLDVMA
jgi:flagellar hook-length control protein FliK